MRQTVLQGLEQAYGNLVRMIADFLPRFLVMLIIIALGLLVALVLKYIVRAVLGLTRLDRVSEELFKCRGKFSHQFYSLVTEDFFVIEFDDGKFPVLRA